MKRFWTLSLASLILCSAPIFAQQIPFGFFKTSASTYDYIGTWQLSLSTYVESFLQDFGQGALASTTLKNNVDGEVELSASSTYPKLDLGGVYISWPEVRRIIADPAKDLIYVGSKYGITVIDTHGSANPADHTILTRYDMSSTTVQIPSGDLNDIFLDTSLGVLYVAIGGGGFMAIDTKNNKNAADDVVLTNFSFVPGGVTGWAYSVMYDPTSKYVYLGTSGQGLLIIDTKGVTDVLQWVYVARYNSGTTPAIADGWVLHSEIDHVTGLLYASTNNGLYVINTQNTDSVADDTLVFNYNQTSTPPVASNWSMYSIRDDANSVLFVSGAYFAAIDTNSTISAADDTEIGRYGTGVLSPTFSWSGSGFFDSTSKYLYLNTSSGAQVIDTKGTKTTADDTVVAVYNATSNPAVASDNVLSQYYDAAHGVLYVGTSAGLSVVSTAGYPAAGSYTSRRFDLATTPHNSISWSQTTPTNTSVSVQYRSGVNTAWTNDFDDNLTTEYAGDFYGWGSSFATVVESGGTLKLSNPSPGSYSGSEYVYFWIDTGQVANYFPIGSKITVKFKVNSNRTQHLTWNDFIFTDDWWDDNGGTFVNNQWQTVVFNVTNKKFSKVGFYVVWEAGTWNAGTDSVEIDQIKIENPSWGAWSAACSTFASCIINQASLAGQDYLQFRMNLASTDPLVTPEVSDVTLSGGYKASEVLTSGALTFPTGNEVYDFNASSVVTPAGTAAVFDYSLDNGVTWNAMTLPFSFPGGSVATIFKWRTTLTSTDPTVTPTVSGVSVTSSSENLAYSQSINPGSSEVATNQLAYTKPGTYTFTVPPGFTSLDIFTLGGGGSGGTCQASSSGSGGGGGGGGYYITNYAVTPGQTFTVVVGAGGVATLACANGANGVTSSFSTIAYGNGGAGGVYAANNGAAGAGGTASGTGGTARTGGSGGAGGSAYYGGTGGGAACPVGNGGVGSVAGGGYGVAGGGAGFLSAGVASTGGDGVGQIGGVGGCGGGSGGNGRVSLPTNASGASFGLGATITGVTYQGGGGFGGGGGGSWSSGTAGGGSGGSGLVWIYMH